MITKGIVEELVDIYRIRVRIPLIDRTPQSSLHTSTENLNVALVCTLPGCDPNIKPGDVVFVAIDDTLEQEAIILGYLYRSKDTETYCDLVLNELTVKSKVTLPFETYIGNTTGKDISNLSGTRDNVQKQLDELKKQVDFLIEHTKKE